LVTGQELHLVIATKYLFEYIVLFFAEQAFYDSFRARSTFIATRSATVWQNTDFLQEAQGEIFFFSREE
jgi:hypothetical protein